MPDETAELLECGCKKETIRYIDDGVYAGFDGYQIWLTCRRQVYFHSIALEPRAFESLVHFSQRYHFIKPCKASSEPGEHQVVLDAIKEC